jgi:perosamine synthetase
MPVHIFGNPCDMSAIEAIARRHGLFIIEDAAEAHGAEYRGKKTGSLSDLAAFSYFSNKNITTGEGGMVVTDNEELYNRCRYFKNLCFPLDKPRVYQHADVGFNYRMSNLHAAIGLAQTEKADDYRALRIRNNKLYREGLKDTPGIIWQKDEKDSLNVCWMNAILIDPPAYGRTRDELIEELDRNGIDTRLVFTGMHRQRSLAEFGCDGSGAYPITDYLTARGFYLPSASSLTKMQIDRIVGVIGSFSRT